MLDHNYDEPFEFNQEDYVEPQNEVLFSKPVNDVAKNPIPPYIMTVDVEEGKSAKLEVYFDSNPTKLAFEFCKAYNLDFDAMQFLTDEIARLVSSKEIQAQRSPISEMPECIQEVDEDINSELYRSQMDLSKQRSDNSKAKEEPSPIKAPLSDKSSITAFTNIEINKTKNISNNNISNIQNNSISSISKPNISRSSKDFQGKPPLDIKQFSYQLFLDKSTNSGDMGVLLKNAAHSKNNSQSNSNNQSGRTTSTKSNIFDKLYNDSKIRKAINLQKSRPSQESVKLSGTVQNANITKNAKENKESSEKINYGERLYIKGLKIKEETSTKIEKLKAEREVTEKQIYTFKPKFIENYYSDSVDLIKVNQEIK